MNINEKAAEAHSQWRGKITIEPNAPCDTPEQLSLAYTPGVAEPCLRIAEDENLSYEYTRRWNMVAVVTDGTAVLGLGDIGPVAGMPVMEGKCLLFKRFGGVDAFPVCIKSKDVDTIVETVRLISGSFGGINLEDISAPRCFEIERRLKKCCDIPIFHDDQHGTAVIATAALKNALKFVGKKIEDLKIIINGAGAAGIAIGRLFASCGARNIIYVDRNGAITPDTEGINSEQRLIADISNPMREKGLLADVVKGADVFVGVSRAGLLTQDMVRSMASQPIIFAMANPIPEIMPDEAYAAGAAVVGTGRSDYPNQINNVLAFPGIFRGVFDCRACDINDRMKLAASDALAALVTEEELAAKKILPSPFDVRVAPAVAAAVKQAAIESGVNRI